MFLSLFIIKFLYIISKKKNKKEGLINYNIYIYIFNKISNLKKILKKNYYHYFYFYFFFFFFIFFFLILLDFF